MNSGSRQRKSYFGNFVWKVKLSACFDFDKNWFLDSYPFFWVADYEYDVRSLRHLTTFRTNFDFSRYYKVSKNFAEKKLLEHNNFENVLKMPFI